MEPLHTIKPGFFQNIGLNRFLAVQGAAGMISGGLEGATGFLESSYNQDGTQFQRAAQGASSFLGRGIEAASSIGWGLGIHYPFKGALGKGQVFDSIYSSNGIMATRTGKGIFGTGFFGKKLTGNYEFNDIFSGEAITGDAANSFRKNAMHGYWRQPAGTGAEGVAVKQGGKFLKGHMSEGWKGFAKLGIGVMAAQFAVNTTLGIAGQLADEAFNSYSSAKRYSYENMPIENRTSQAWQQQAQQTTMNAVGNFENTLSLSRIYHRR